MNRLAKVEFVWNNLDTEYASYCEAKGTEISKRVFLEKLLSYKKDADSPLCLKSMLQEESDKYSSEEYARYERLMHVLTSVYHKLLSDAGEVSDFSTYVLGSEEKSVDILDTEVFNSDPILTDVFSALSDGVYLESFWLKDDKIKKYVLGHQQPGYVAFRNNRDVATFLGGGFHEIEQSDFLRKVYYVVGSAIIAKDFVVPSVFLDKTLYKLRGRVAVMGKYSEDLRDIKCIKVPAGKMCLTAGQELDVPEMSYYVKDVSMQAITISVYFVE